MDLPAIAANTTASLLARMCERSMLLIRALRVLDFRGKEHVVTRIRPEFLPGGEVHRVDGIQYNLDLGDELQRQIFFRVLERREIAFVLNEIPLPRDAVYLDIGANVGYYSLQLAARLAPGGVIHAFECDPLNYQRLVANIRLNGFQGAVTAHPVAVSDADASAVFHRSVAANSGWGSLEHYPDIAGEPVRVATVTLDTFLRRHRIETVHLMKVDIEGHEMHFLQGAREALRNRIARYVLIEFNGPRLHQLGRAFGEFVAPFLENGYAPVGPGARTMAEIRTGAIPPERLCATMMFGVRA